ncbi:MAG: undecaprenyl-diphosphate phosphatase [Calditrichaeota bacterium]|nr:undecaprenyl-diphosphate phosphatase [Calditrichota bacterium]RQV92942.1 MAG: undecaprenyl-diphosphate phosphatase [bacterium]RQW07989.1 MAG: undecaprenyl-diphosphate phosphatase [Calditrichota bacterium]
MDLLKALILGIIQGLSEFLPISSSGHLVIAEYLMDFRQGGLAFEVFVHFGTLLAILWAFRKDICLLLRSLPAVFRLSSPDLPAETREYALWDIYIIIGSIPAAVIGLFFEDAIEQIFEDHFFALVMLFFTGIIVWSSRYTRKKRENMNGWHAFLIGVAQALAILPGISRSGTTIVTGLWLGIPRLKAARFSFLLSSPVIFGATLLKFFDVFENPLPSSELVTFLAAGVAAAISGYFAIVWLLRIIQEQKFEWFGVYCVVVSIAGIIFHFLG